MSNENEYNAKDIEAATRGLVNSGVLRSWVSRSQYPGPLVYPRQRGRAAKYSLAEVHLLAIAAELRRMGLPIGNAMALAILWIGKFYKGELPAFIFWRPDEDDVEGDGYIFVSPKDYYSIGFNPFESLGGAISGLDVLSVIKRVDQILAERHGDADA